jgi:hypothetical protein
MTKYAQPILFFYCTPVRTTSFKTSPHFAEQRARFAERRKAEAAQAKQAKKPGRRKGKKPSPEAPPA